MILKIHKSPYTVTLPWTLQVSFSITCNACSWLIAQHFLQNFWYQAFRVGSSTMNLQFRESCMVNLLLCSHLLLWCLGQVPVPHGPWQCPQLWRWHCSLGILYPDDGHLLVTLRQQYRARVHFKLISKIQSVPPDLSLLNDPSDNWLYPSICLTS